ncbi:MAG: lactonase family protein [FCB group bacterium]|nr:lactonase family protein [FCB group bacterium]MBL7028341.1 lactonase family protein [Candidatus Neomarinimicrobiota bacterium]MBL7121660.1 lactonase family protein [Candidatus Neomarinimicrobiota bacterium]
MKLLWLTNTLTALLVLSGCHTIKEETVNTQDTQIFYLGTYTEGASASEGIYKYELTASGGVRQIGLAVMSENPSFLALSADKKFLVAINEVKNEDGVGTVESYMVFEDTLILLNRQSSGGAHPCFVSVNEAGYVLTANYTGGNVGLLKLEEDGPLSELLDVQQHTGKGATDRQEAPHAHSAWFSPIDGSIISIDLGTNELWFSSIDADGQKLIPATPEKLSLNPGDGPRHLTFHPNGKWIYVANELSSSVTRLDRSKDGSYSMGSTVSSLPVGYSAPNTCADIHISSDGQFVYASNRGHNSIAVLKVNEADGSLKLLGNKGCGGEGPRNFSLSPDENFMLVANQRTNNIVTLKRDPSTGMLKYVSQVEAPTPVCIIF